MSYFEEFLSGDIKQVAERIQQREAELKDQVARAGRVVKLFEEEGWQDVMEQIEVLGKLFIRTPEQYLADADTKKLVGMDTGARYFASLLKGWIEDQQKIINAAAEEK